MVGSTKPRGKYQSIQVKPMDKTTIIFHSAIKSDKTKKLYNMHIRQFREYFINRSRTTYKL